MNVSQSQEAFTNAASNAYKTDDGNEPYWDKEDKEWELKTNIFELINLSKGGSYYVECTEEEYDLFYNYGWKEGAIRLCISNTKRKLEMIEDKIKNEVSTRKNNKHIESLKAKRTGLLNKYAMRKVELNKIKANGKEKCV